MCNEYASREGIAVVGVYSDYAVSGRTDDRPQFQTMIDNAGESDIVLVYAMDRFSRDQYDAPIYKKKLMKKGVRVVSATERIDASPDGIIMEKLLEGLAARESLVTSQRVRRGMEGNAKKAMYNGVPMLGYKVDPSTKKYVVDDAEAAVVREIFDRRLNREAYNSIATDLQKRGIKTPYGRKCTAHYVSDVVANERYTGVYIWGDVRIEDGMPQIIDKDTWAAAQSVRGKKRRAEEEFHDYALSGKLICGKCGKTLQGTSGYGKKHVRYDYYRCKCGAKSIRREAAEGPVVDAIRQMLDGEEAYTVAEAVEKAWRGSGATCALDTAKKRLEAAKDGQKRIIAAIEAGMPYASVKDRMEELVEEQQNAEREVALHAHDAEFSVDDFVDFLRFGATLDDSTLLSAFVFQVLAKDDAFVVTLNFNTKKNAPARIEIPAEVFEQVKNGGLTVRLCEHMLAVIGGTVNMVVSRK